MVAQISRVTRSPEQTRTAYNRMSKCYDLFAGSSERKFVDAGLAKLKVREGEKVLEIGCGTGNGLVILARSVGKKGKVYGIDISEEMIHKARQKLEKKKLINRVEIIRSNALHLPYSSNTFDKVFLSFTLELFDTPEIPLVLSKCRKVLKEKGRICVVGISKNSRNGIMMQLYTAAHRHFPTYIDCRPIFIEHLLKDSGFEIIDTETCSMWGLPVDIVLAKP